MHRGIVAFLAGSDWSLHKCVRAGVRCRETPGKTVGGGLGAETLNDWKGHEGSIQAAIQLSTWAGIGAQNGLLRACQEVN